MALSNVNSSTNAAAAATAATTQSKSDIEKVKLGDNFDQFLLLLTTQLKNQDPTQPMDTNQFVQQLVSFTGVEQQIETNKNLETIISNSKQSQLDRSVSYLGKEVVAEGNTAELKNKNAEFTYELDNKAQNVEFAIFDAAGRMVFSGFGATEKGLNVVTWDGVNSFTNQDAPEGTYSFQVKAVDREGNEVKNKTFASGIVTGVSENSEGDGFELLVGNTLIDVTKVKAVREPRQAG
jgi:flagellar basal-body rod modification protein FlgD